MNSVAISDERLGQIPSPELDSIWPRGMTPERLEKSVVNIILQANRDISEMRRRGHRPNTTVPLPLLKITDGMPQELRLAILEQDIEVFDRALKHPQLWEEGLMYMDPAEVTWLDEGKRKQTNLVRLSPDLAFVGTIVEGETGDLLQVEAELWASKGLINNFLLEHPPSNFGNVYIS
jgi:hypothetical protein